ncbi:hypothetical protein TNCV_1579711 [Trichonephila clavipes]|nr:hypothetical protein TNCV_1579711 [Trichonephila clavipes]
MKKSEEIGDLGVLPGRGHKPVGSETVEVTTEVLERAFSSFYSSASGPSVSGELDIPWTSSSCASSSNAEELDEPIQEVKINPLEKNTVSDTSTNKDTLSKEKESENENEETKLIRNDFAHCVGTPIDADLRE